MHIFYYAGGKFEEVARLFLRNTFRTQVAETPEAVLSVRCTIGVWLSEQSTPDVQHRTQVVCCSCV